MRWKLTVKFGPLLRIADLIVIKIDKIKECFNFKTRI